MADLIEKNKAKAKAKFEEGRLARQQKADEDKKARNEAL